MDFIVVTFGPDLKLLRHFLASYELYYQNKNKLILFSSMTDKPLLDQMMLPENTVSLVKEDFPEVLGTDDYSQQHYFKLLAHKFVDTEYYCIMDSDFVFLRPTYDQDFFDEGKPRCFFRPWVEGEPALWKRKPSESFLGFAGAFVFNTHAEWIFKRSICAELSSTLRLEGMLNQPNVSELQIYGMYAYRYHQQEHVWICPAPGTSEPIGASVNQVPPAYNLDLDPESHFGHFERYRYVQFWSQWELAEQKMIEFFEDSQKYHYGHVVLKANRSPLSCIIDLSDISKGNYRYFDGVFSDGWVKEEVKFRVKVPERHKSIVIELMVPPDPEDRKWTCTGLASMDERIPAQPFNLKPGTNKLNITLKGTNQNGIYIFTLKFGKGFKYTENPDSREFRARLMAVCPF
jgi:hypothetical protein